MATIGLKIAEMTATELGNKSNTMWKVRSAEGVGNDGTDKQINVIFDVYESRAKYDAGDNPLATAGVDHRRTLLLPVATESSETSLHQELKSVLEGEGKTVTEETDV